MRSSRRIMLWVAPLALVTLISQRFPACAGEATFPASDTGPGTATLELGGANKTQAIAWDQIGAKAGADYHGDRLAVLPTPEGVRLHGVFQRLESEATTGGLWLTSTVTNQTNDRFQVKAARLGRVAATAPLPATGTVRVAGQTVLFARAGLVEEYAVSMDGVRQDFVVTEKPAGAGQLTVHLAVSGARVEATANGAQLVLEKSGRKIAYTRLHATDAKGKELPARIEVQQPSAFDLAVVVNDAGAVYPVRIDPTFSDANWNGMASGMGGEVGGEDLISVGALAVSGTNLYAGGSFTTAGGKFSPYVAEANILGPTVVKQPQTQSAEVGATVDFSVAGLGGSLTYELFFNGTNLHCCSTNAWVTLGTVTLTNTSQLYFDLSAPGQPARLYKILPVP